MPFVIVAMALAILAAVFALQNAMVVPVHFIFLQSQASLALVILGSVFLGFLLGSVFAMYVKFRGFLVARKKNEEIKALNEQRLLLEKQAEELKKLLEDRQAAIDSKAGREDYAEGAQMAADKPKF
jgi:uncharacterized integral membrane protein